jgi:hypothetical protein
MNELANVDIGQSPQNVRTSTEWRSLNKRCHFRQEAGAEMRGPVSNDLLAIQKPKKGRDGNQYPSGGRT